jgi:hypothetical protein
LGVDFVADYPNFVFLRKTTDLSAPGSGFETYSKKSGITLRNQPQQVIA